MQNEDSISVEASIAQVLGTCLYAARIANGHEVVAHVRRCDAVEAAGLQVGHGIRLEMSPFDMSKGRILFNKNVEKTLK